MVEHQDRVWIGFGIFMGAMAASLAVGLGYFRRIPKEELPRRSHTGPCGCITALCCRSRGVFCPWDFRQFLVVCVFIYIEFTFWAFLWPSLEGSTAWTVLVLHALLAAATVMLFFLMVSWDPQEGLVTESIPGNPPNKYCDQCDAWFPGVKRRHCSRCKRCVTGFDHHCWFVNTCISHDTNYWGE